MVVIGCVARPDGLPAGPGYIMTRKSAFRPRHARARGKSGRECLCHEGLCGAGTADQGANPGLVASSSAWLRRRLAPNRRPKRPNRTPARDPGPFNAHNPDGGRSGLVQHVLRSPARIPAIGISVQGSVRRAGKRKTLYVAIYARTSPDCPLSAEDQVQRLKTVAAERGWTVVADFHRSADIGAGTGSTAWRGGADRCDPQRHNRPGVDLVSLPDREIVA